jgi:kynurenine formamidase
MAGDARPIAPEELAKMFEELKNWGRWGAEDQRGALNLITPAKRQAAARLVREGVSVSGALPLKSPPGPFNTNPVVHHMIRAGDLVSPEGYGVTLDYFALGAHGLTITHLDALCHILYDGLMYNGRKAAEITSAGTRFNAIDVSDQGIVSRGVLLDIPSARGLPYLEPGEAIYEEELEAAEKAQNVTVEEGDVLYVYTGRWRREAEQGAWNPRERLAGLHMSAMPWLKRRGVAVLACDGISDVIPSGLQGLPPIAGRPIHILTLPAMGVHLVDNCGLEDLARACSERGQWEFLTMIATLKLAGGTGCPVNPIAVF